MLFSQKNNEFGPYTIWLKISGFYGKIQTVVVFYTVGREVRAEVILPREVLFFTEFGLATVCFERSIERCAFRHVFNLRGLLISREA